MYNFVLTGTKGMNNAVWRKLEKATTGASQKTVERDMGNWEVCSIMLDEPPIKSAKVFPRTILLDIIGPRIIKKYSIQIN
jgi:hypothetical protein